MLLRSLRFPCVFPPLLWRRCYNLPKKCGVLTSTKSWPVLSGVHANHLDPEQPVPHRAATGLQKSPSYHWWWEALGMQGGNSAVRVRVVPDVLEARRDWVRSPGD